MTSHSIRITFEIHAERGVTLRGFKVLSPVCLISFIQCAKSTRVCSKWNMDNNINIDRGKKRVLTDVSIREFAFDNLFSCYNDSSRSTGHHQVVATSRGN